MRAQGEGVNALWPLLRPLHCSLSASEALDVLHLISPLVVVVGNCLAGLFKGVWPLLFFQRFKIQIQGPILHVVSEAYGVRSEKMGGIGEILGGVA